MRAALNSTYKAADSRQFFTDNLCLQHSAHTSTLWLLRALRLACMWRGNTDSSNKRKQEDNSDCSALITLSASMNLVWTTQICAPHDSGPRITVMTVILLMTSLYVNIQTFLCVINVTLAAAATLFSPLCVHVWDVLYVMNGEWQHNHNGRLLRHPVAMQQGEIGRLHYEANRPVTVHLVQFSNWCAGQTVYDGWI